MDIYFMFFLETPNVVLCMACFNSLPLLQLSLKTSPDWLDSTDYYFTCCLLLLSILWRLPICL